MTILGPRRSTAWFSSVLFLVFSLQLVKKIYYISDLTQILSWALVIFACMAVLVSIGMVGEVKVGRFVYRP